MRRSDVLPIAATRSYDMHTTSADQEQDQGSTQPKNLHARWWGCGRLLFILPQTKRSPRNLHSLLHSSLPFLAPVPSLGRQHVGKTTASLGIISGLKKRFKNVGFIKPVGQQHELTEGGILVDKVSTILMLTWYITLNILLLRTEC